MRAKLLGVCLAAVPVWLLVAAHAEDKKSDPPPPARPAAEAGELTFDGQIQAEASAALSSRIAGVVDKVNVDEGDRVKKGQVLMELSAPELKDDLDAAAARLDQAKAEVEQAEAAAQEAEARAKATDAARDVAAAGVARARAGVKVARAGVEVAQAAVRRAQTQLGFTRIVAPYDGVVARLTVDVGTTVGPQRQGESAPLVTVMRDDVMHIVFAVDERSAPRVAVGAPLVIRAPGVGDAVFKGKLTRMAGAFNPDTGTTRAEGVAPNAEGKLRPGMFVTVEVKPEEVKR